MPIAGIQISSGFVKNTKGPLDKKTMLNDTDRLALTRVQRKLYMEVKNPDNGIIYELINDPSGDTTTNADWRVLTNASTSDVQDILVLSNGQTVFTLLNSITLPGNKTQLYVNGKKCKYGNEYTFTNSTTMNWLNTSYELSTTDEVELYY